MTPSDLAQLRLNLDRIRDRIAQACEAAGRPADSVRLVAVTKYAGAGYARALLDLGQRDLGENRVDHLVGLAEALADHDPAPRWHMIGHLQRNKAKKVAALLSGLHSLDRLELAEQLAQRRPTDLPPLETWIQIRLGAGADRSGIAPDELTPLLERASTLTQLKIVGLMGLPPIGAPEEARPHFQQLAALARGIPGMTSLSMGMTADLEVAIAEGATIVRVGRALLDGLSDDAREAT